MEVRTIYVAFPNTSYEVQFKTEEECLNYELRMTPKMWDRLGNPTLKAEEAMFVKIEEGMVEYLFDKYGEDNFFGLEKGDYGYFYWDDWDEKFHYLHTGTIKRVQKFIDEHNIVSCL